MESKKFIKSKLESIHSLFKNMGVRYEYRDNISTHIIEVKPIDFFNNNNAYIDLEMQLEDEFYNLFPNEELLFVTMDSLTKINIPEFELAGAWVIENYYTSLLTPTKSNINENVIIENDNYALAA